MVAKAPRPGGAPPLPVALSFGRQRGALSKGRIFWDSCPLKPGGWFD